MIINQDKIKYRSDCRQIHFLNNSQRRIGRIHSEEDKEKQRQKAIDKNPINSNYFKRLNIRNAYVLGYLFADGHFRKRKRCYKSGIKFKIKSGLSFSSIDKELIKKIKNEIGIENRKTGIKHRKGIHRKVTFVIFISNYHFLQYLKKLGMPYGKKADRIRIPRAVIKDKRLFFAFFRGFFDGDGTINSILYAKYAKVGIYTASYKFLMQMKDLMQKFHIKSYNVIKSKTSRTMYLGFGGKENVYKLYKLMYKNSNNLFLSRKKKRFDEFFRSYGWN